VQEMFPTYERHVLSNGLMVALMQERALPLVVFRLVTRSGACCDPAGQEGTARLTAELLHKGTVRQSTHQFSEAVEYCGGEIESVADLDTSLAGGEFLAKDLQRGLRLFAEFIREPRFADGDIIQERDRLIADIDSRRDNPAYLAGLHYNRFLFGAHPYGRPISGTVESLSRITPGDIRKFYRTWYTPNNMVLSIVGDFQPEQVLPKLEALFGDWPAGDAPSVDSAHAESVVGRKVLIIDKPDLTQSQVRFGNIGMARTNPDYFKVLVANNILGGGFTSRLVSEVRVNRGLSYHVRSRFKSLRQPGDFTILTSTKNTSTREIIDVSLREIQRIREEPVSEEELNGTKKYLTGLFPLGLEGIESLAKLITDIEYYNLEPGFPNQYTGFINATSVDEVQSVSRKYFSHDDLAIVVVGKAADIQADLADLGPVTVQHFEEGLPLLATGNAG
jgi:zinc protease